MPGLLPRMLPAILLLLAAAPLLRLSAAILLLRLSTPVLRLPWRLLRMGMLGGLRMRLRRRGRLLPRPRRALKLSEALAQHFNFVLVPDFLALGLFKNFEDVVHIIHHRAQHRNDASDFLNGFGEPWAGGFLRVPKCMPRGLFVGEGVRRFLGSWLVPGGFGQFRLVCLGGFRFGVLHRGFRGRFPRGRGMRFGFARLGSRGLLAPAPRLRPLGAAGSPRRGFGLSCCRIGTRSWFVRNHVGDKMPASDAKAMGKRDATPPGGATHVFRKENPSSSWSADILPPPEAWLIPKRKKCPRSRT
jgi:hypothetical protein